ncbi:MAG: hypothetical protein ACK5NC_10105 [Vibrio sp.]
MKKIASISILTFALFSVIGCAQQDQDQFKSDSKEAVQATKEAGRTIGHATRDATRETGHWFRDVFSD